MSDSETKKRPNKPLPCFYGYFERMDEEIRMSVSSMTRTETKKALYVMFTRGEDMAELVLPDLKVFKNKGFSEDEIGRLLDYIDGSRDEIYALAKKIDPIKAMLEP